MEPDRRDVSDDAPLDAFDPDPQVPETDAGPEENGGAPLGDAGSYEFQVDAGAPSEAMAPAWIALAGGTFDMGSNAAANSQPVHAVTVPALEMSRTEVTVAQFAACVNAGTCTAPGTFTASCYWNSPGYEDHPINCVSHTQAQQFCAWAGGSLPSEAQWEYAARSQGQAKTFPWGEAPASCALAVINEGGDGCGTGTPWAVCSKTMGNTDQGLCDMTGNVFEWTLDGWHANYTGAPTDGSAWTGGNPLVRGGSFQGAWNTTQRGVYFGPSYVNVFLGFRCVR